MFEGHGPMDSHDMYAMGLRPPRCNGCKLAQLRWELGDRFLMLAGSVYELDAEPRFGQGEPQEHEGRPVRWHFWGMIYNHSDECYGWKPPSERSGWLSPIERVKLNLSRILRSESFYFLREAWRRRGKARKRPMTAWRTLDGQVVLLAEMTPKHLVNAHRTVEVRGTERARRALGEELERRGLRRRQRAWADGDGRPVAGRVRMGMVRRGR